MNEWRRLPRVPAWLPATALGGLVALWALDPANRPGTAEGNDFRVYYEGAAGFAATGNPYGTGFVSPAPFAFLLVPLAALPADAAALLWLLLSLAALLGLGAASLVLAGLPVRSWLLALVTAALFLWPANNYGLVLGQNSVWIALLATLAAAATRAQPAVAGALLAVGAVAKPHLVVLLAAGLAADDRRRGRGLALAGTFAATGAALVVAAGAYSRRWVDVLLAAPPESWNYWGSTIGTNVFAGAVLGDRDAGWFVLAVLGVTLLIGGGVWCWRAAPDPGQLASASLAATLLVTPYAYPHDYVILALPLVWAAVRLRASLGPRSLPALAALVALAWLAPVPARYTDDRFLALVLPAVLLALVLRLGPSSSDRPDVARGS